MVLMIAMIKCIDKCKDNGIDDCDDNNSLMSARTMVMMMIAMIIIH